MMVLGGAEWFFCAKESRGTWVRDAAPQLCRGWSASGMGQVTSLGTPLVSSGTDRTDESCEPGAVGGTRRRVGSGWFSEMRDFADGIFVVVISRPLLWAVCLTEFLHSFLMAFLCSDR